MRQEVNGPWRLNRDFTGSIDITASSRINLSGKTILLNSGGITLNSKIGGSIYGEGRLTSTHEYVEINLKSGVKRAHEEDHGLYISAVISDSSTKVGLRISGVHEGTNRVRMVGDTSNTFTGKIIVKGTRNHLVLGKENGATAIQGDIYISDKGTVNFIRSNQISKTSKINVDKGTVFFGLVHQNSHNTIHKLEIDNSGTIGFGAIDKKGTTRTVYIDQLIFDSESTLKITGWKHARDFLLICKGSTDMEELIKKTSFAGYHHQYVHYREYDKDYWELSALPESEAYGAILGATALTLAIWRRREKQRIPASLIRCRWPL